MFYFLSGIVVLSILILAFEILYVMLNMSSDMHAILFFYLIGALINNVGYMFEITASGLETAYLATKFLYLGKIFIPIGLFIFAMRYCRIKFPKWAAVTLLTCHAFFYVIIATNDYHHLYYSSITFVNEGLFPHNVYGHGPLYFVYQSVPIIYSIIAVICAFRAYRGMRTKAEKLQLFYLILAPVLTMLGVLVFFTGITRGFDVSNLGYFLSSVCMLLALFRYKMIDTVAMVKTNLVDELKDGVIAIDPVDNVAYMNITARKIMPGLVVGRNGTYSGLIQDMDRRVMNKERMEINGRLYSLFKHDLYQNDIYRGKIYVMDDITDTEEYTKQIMLEKERADSANQAKSQFLSNMSHEIRTPMNAIVGMTDIVLRDELPAADRGYLENIKSSGNALLDIINDILDFSKIESGRMEVIEEEYYPLPFLQELKVMFTTRIGDKPIRLAFDIDDNLPAKLYGDHIKIRQVITNIVNNAIKFTEVGYVKVNISVTNTDESHIDMKVEVKDSGQGISEEDLPKIFESFTQVDSKRNHAKEGTGLGLPISKSLIEMMGGKISVSSEYGTGTTFVFDFPQKVIDATKATEIVYTKKDDGVTDFVAPNARILLVEDNEINVKVVQGLLAPTKIRIDVARNGLESLKMVNEKCYDIVFMDHMMPVMDGIEATGRIRNFEDEYFRRVPIVALSANAVVGAKEEFLSAGMNDFLGKPIQFKDLCVMIRKWLPTEMIETAAKIEEEVTEKEEVKMDMGIEKSGLGVLDKEIGLQYCGTEELLNSVLEDFYHLIDDKSEKIIFLKETGNIKDYTIEVHALKSTARMIGATELSELAFKLEMAGKEDNTSLIEEETDRLITMYRAYKDTLSYFDKDDSEKTEVSTGEIKSELEKMLSAVSEFDMDGVDEAMAKLREFKMPTSELEEEMKELYNRVRDVDMDQITQRCGRLIASL